MATPATEATAGLNGARTEISITPPSDGVTATPGSASASGVTEAEAAAALAFFDDEDNTADNDADKKIEDDEEKAEEASKEKTPEIVPPVVPAEAAPASAAPEPMATDLEVPQETGGDADDADPEDGDEGDEGDDGEGEEEGEEDDLDLEGDEADEEDNAANASNTITITSGSATVISGPTFENVDPAIVITTQGQGNDKDTKELAEAASTANNKGDAERFDPNALLDQLQTELEDAIERCDRLDAENADRKLKIESLENKVEALTTACEEFREQTRLLTNENANFAELTDKALKASQQHEAEIKALGEAHTATLEAVKANLTAANTKNATLEEELKTRHEADVKALGERYDASLQSLNQQLLTANNEKHTLSQELSAKTRELADAKSAHQEKEDASNKTIADLEAQLEAAKTEIKSLKPFKQQIDEMQARFSLSKGPLSPSGASSFGRKSISRAPGTPGVKALAAAITFSATGSAAANGSASASSSSNVSSSASTTNDASAVTMPVVEPAAKGGPSKKPKAGKKK